MPNDELIVIVTRMSGVDSEFEQYFGNDDKVCVVVCDENRALSYTTIPSAEAYKNSTVIYFDGLARANNSYSQLRAMIQDVCSEKKILLGYHPGVNMTLKEAQQELKYDSLDNISARSYSIGGDIRSSAHPIVQLGSSMELLLSGISGSNLAKNYKMVRDYILGYDTLLSSLLNLFLSLDIDMQALEILFRSKEQEAKSYFKEMRTYWNNKRIRRQWAKAGKLTDEIYDEDIRNALSSYTSSDFIALLNSISKGQWDRNNDFRSWFSEIVLSTKKQIKK